MTRIYEAQDHLLIHAGYGDPAEHRHRAAQMVFSFSGLMRVRLKNEIQICRGILIPSGVTHAINTGDQPALILLYDCSTGVAKQMQFLKCVPEKICDRIIRSYCAFAQDETPEKYAAFEQTLMEQLGLMKSTGGVTDERIASAMQYVRDMISERPTCQETADHVFLSQGRFSHLFREQTGMTFASYV